MSVVPANQAGLAALGEGIQGTVSNNVTPAEASFTARLQLLHGPSKVRVDWDKSAGPKPEEGNFWCGPPGGYFLGKKFYCVPLAWRDHALLTQDENVKLESYNKPQVGQLPKSDLESIFVQIEQEVNRLKKEKVKGRQARVGKDILLWIPPQEQADKQWPGITATGKFAVYYLAGTAVPEADNFKANFNRKIECRSREVPGKSFTWYVPEVDMHEDGSLRPDELPDMEQAKAELVKFANPVAKGDDMPKQGVAEAADGRPR